MEALLTRHPIVFGLSTRGQASNLHTADQDPLWVSNTKRAIVSLLQLDRTNAEVGAEKYAAVEHDVTGTCEAEHHVGRRGDAHLTVERLKTPSKDCSYRAVEHGDTPEVHREMLSMKTSEDSLMTRHYFHGQTGRLDKVKYAESHSSAVHGNPNQITTTTSSGYLNFRSMAALETVQAETGSNSSSSPSTRSRRTLKQTASSLEATSSASSSPRLDDDDAEAKLVLEQTGIFFQHGAQDQSPSQRRQRRAAGIDDAHDEFISDAEAQAVVSQLLNNVRAIADAPTTTGRIYVESCQTVKRYPLPTVQFLFSILLRGDTPPAFANAIVDVLAGSGSDLAYEALLEDDVQRVATVGKLLRSQNQTLRAMHVFSQSRRPSPRLFELVTALKTGNGTLHQVRVTTMLTLGSMARASFRAGDTGHAGSSTAAHRALDMLVADLRRSVSAKEQTLALMALGNAGDAPGTPRLGSVVLPYLTATASRQTRIAAIKSVRFLERTDHSTIRARRKVVGVYLSTFQSSDDAVRLAAYRAIADHDPSDEELRDLAFGTLSISVSPNVKNVVVGHLQDMSKNNPNLPRRRVARGLLDDLAGAGGFVDFSGTNLKQLKVKLGFMKREEFFFIGDNAFGVSVGYNIEDTVEIIIPLSGAVQFEAVVDNRAFANVYAFGMKFSLLEFGAKIDGLVYKSQWWGGDERRQRRYAVDDAANHRLMTNRGARKRERQRRLARLAAVPHFPADDREQQQQQARDSDKRTRKNVVLKQYRWPNGVIPYAVDSGVSLSEITAAIGEYETNTCLRFVERSNEKVYLKFQRAASECTASGTGRPTSNGPVTIKVSPGNCDAAEMLHMIGHAVGMVHESNRPDRDDYVDIFLDNVNSNAKVYFKKAGERSGVLGSSSVVPGSSYDLGSIMHPKHDEDSNNGESTMKMKDGSTTFGRGSSLTNSDDAKIEYMYGSMCVAKVNGGHKCEYTVVPGDSLSQIAVNLNSKLKLTGQEAVSVSLLQRLNQDEHPELETNPNLIQVGWVLDFCFVENQRGFEFEFPSPDPADTSATQDVVTQGHSDVIFKVKLTSQPTSDVTLQFISSDEAIIKYDRSVQGDVVFTKDDWHMYQQVILADDAAKGSATMTVKGVDGDYDTAPRPTAMFSYLKTEKTCFQDNEEAIADPNECIDCPSTLPTKCDENICSVSETHCSTIRGCKDESFMPKNNEAPPPCDPVPSGTIQGCGDWSLSWMPPGYQANLKAWCETEFPSTYTDELKGQYSCIVAEVQHLIGAYSGSYTNKVQQRVSKAVTYEKESMEKLYTDMHRGWDGQTSLSDKLLATFNDGYKQCCCAVSPCKLVSWLAVNPAEAPAEVVQTNTLLFGTCESKNELNADPPAVDGYFWLDVLEATYAWCWDAFGDHCREDLDCGEEKFDKENPKGGGGECPDFGSPGGVNPPGAPNVRRRRSREEIMARNEVADLGEGLSLLRENAHRRQRRLCIGNKEACGGAHVDNLLGLLSGSIQLAGTEIEKSITKAELDPDTVAKVERAMGHVGGTGTFEFEAGIRAGIANPSFVAYDIKLKNLKNPKLDLAYTIEVEPRLKATVGLLYDTTIQKETADRFAECIPIDFATFDGKVEVSGITVFEYVVATSLKAVLVVEGVVATSAGIDAQATIAFSPTIRLAGAVKVADGEITVDRPALEGDVGWTNAAGPPKIKLSKAAGASATVYVKLVVGTSVNIWLPAADRPAPAPCDVGTCASLDDTKNIASLSLSSMITLECNLIAGSSIAVCETAVKEPSLDCMVAPMTVLAKTVQLAGGEFNKGIAKAELSEDPPTLAKVQTAMGYVDGVFEAGISARVATPSFVKAEIDLKDRKNPSFDIVYTVEVEPRLNAEVELAKDTAIQLSAAVDKSACIPIQAASFDGTVEVAGVTMLKYEVGTSLKSVLVVDGVGSSSAGIDARATISLNPSIRIGGSVIVSAGKITVTDPALQGDVGWTNAAGPPKITLAKAAGASATVYVKLVVGTSVNIWLPAGDRPAPAPCDVGTCASSDDINNIASLSMSSTITLECRLTAGASGADCQTAVEEPALDCTTIPTVFMDRFDEVSRPKIRVFDILAGLLDVDSLIDWVKDALLPCWDSGPVTLAEWRWEFFRIKQTIPIFGGISLILEAGSGAFIEIIATFQVCPTQLTASASIGPVAGVDVWGSASIGFYIVRAGVKITALLLDTKVTASARVEFSFQDGEPFKLCFDLKYVLQPISATFLAFAQIRDSIKWCKVGFAKIPWIRLGY